MSSNFTHGQSILINLDARRAPRPGTFTDWSDRDGYAFVAYTNAKTGEVIEKEIKMDKITAAEVDTDGIDAPVVDEVPEVQVDEVDVQGPHTHDECEDLDSCTAEHLTVTVIPAPARPKAAAKAPKKAELPEGYVTPVGLAKEINARGLYSGSGARGFTSQMLYTMSAKDETFPGETVNGRYAVKLEAGIEWWNARTERIANRKAASPKSAIRVSEELRGQLEAHAEQAGKSVAELVEYALTQFLSA